MDDACPTASRDLDLNIRNTGMVSCGTFWEHLHLRSMRGNSSKINTDLYVRK